MDRVRPALQLLAHVSASRWRGTFVWVADGKNGRFLRLALGGKIVEELRSPHGFVDAQFLRR